MPITDSTEKQEALKKFLWSSLDRVIFIGVGVVGTIATTYITGMMKLNPPELVASPAFSHIDASRAVAGSVGDLKLDYEEETPRPYGVLRVDIGNEGRGTAENVRFQVKLPDGLQTAYHTQPDFKVYTPSAVTLDKNEFYAELAHFPSGAQDFVALRVEGDAKLLKDARIKLVNDEYEGKVASIEGLE